MNEAFYRYALAKLKSISLTDMQMIARTHGITLVRKPMQSRNKREGRYAGKLYGQHWRSRHYRSPSHYAKEMAPYLKTRNQEAT